MIARFLLTSMILASLLTASCKKREAVAEVTFWHIQTYEPTKPAVEADVARAEAAMNGTRVRAEAIKNDLLKTKLATAMSTHTAPDVFHTWGGGILATYARHGRVMDLTGKLPEVTAKLHPAALSFCTSDDRLYAIPVDISIVPMWYNRRLFAQAGVEPPTTMEEFLAVCAKLKAAGITPVALGNAESWPGCFFFVYLATRAGGAEPLANGDFQHAAFVEAGTWIQRLVKAGVFADGFNGLGYDDARRAFFNGEAAMMLMGTWLLAHADAEASPEMRAQLGFFPFPGLGRDEVADRTVVGGTNAAYAANAATAHPEDALTLLRHLADETALKRWADATHRLPALTREAHLALIGEPPAVAQIFYDAPRLQLYYDQYLPPALAEEHKQTTQALFALTKTPEAAAKAMADTAAKAR